MAKKSKGTKRASKAAVKKKGVKKVGAKRGFTTALPPAPYRCVPTPDPARCLKYMYNPATGRYDIPSGGVEVSCASCKYF
jgi:hypothetical protein